MARSTPLRSIHEHAGASFLIYGPGDAEPGPVELVETFGELELEYAAVRKSCAILDQPHRGVVELTGPDRVDFLNRMLTQELKGLQPGQVRRSFWLNRKGRIDADVRVVHLADRTLLEMDVHATVRTLAGLSAYVITEDVALTDRSESLHSVSLHGPTAGALLRHAVGELDVARAPIEPGASRELTVDGASVLVFRHDTAGEPGFEILIPIESAARVYARLVSLGADPNRGTPAALADPSTLTIGSGVRLREIGWHAYNIARIEAGTPLYHIDFGPDSLPAETGVIDDRVSFTKGCYLGQEIVARMHARGHPKRRLVALKLERVIDLTSGATPARQPGVGAPVFGPIAKPANRSEHPTENTPGNSPESVPESQPESAGDPIGAVTSSTTGPMLAGASICLAQVKFDLTTPGAALRVSCDDVLVPAAVQPGLAFWTRPGG